MTIMNAKMLELLKDLADVLEKHNGGLTYNYDDDGVHVTIGEEWDDRICIGFPDNGDVSKMRNIIQYNQQ